VPRHTIGTFRSLLPRFFVSMVTVMAVGVSVVGCCYCCCFDATVLGLWSQQATASACCEQIDKLRLTLKNALEGDA
jgi:hypothetical protein